jgi:type IV secretion system protein TrbL
MGGTGVIDRFLEVFTRYIDSGFGLLGGEVAFVATTLIVIDITLAALFWSWGADEDIIARLVKKTLFVGVFAFIISNWNALARIVFENFVQIVVLLFAWAMVLLAFFILAIQLFVTLIEFKLTTLAGFVLIPFGLFGQTAFLAERVLGNVVSSGVKVLVLAVVIGIGSTLFSEFTAGFGGNQPTIEDAMAIVLAALSLLGLGIFGPGIANGLISGGPQLGAGSAVGTAVAAGGAVVAGGAAAGMAVRGAGAAIGATAAAARGGAVLAGGATTSYSLASAGQSGAAGVASGLSGVARAGAAAAARPVSRAASRASSAMAESYRGGARSAAAATGGSSTMGTIGGAAAGDNAPSPSSPPVWAQRMKRHQAMSHGATAAAHAVRSGDSHGGGASISLRQDQR